MDNRRPSIWPGLILVIIGAVLLLYNLDIFNFGWHELYPIILMGIGVLFFTSIIGKRHKGAVFPGTILFLLGLFYFLRNYEIIPYYYMREVWPVILIIVGLAFFAVFLTNPRDWGQLIPAGTLLVLGIGFLLRELNIIRWNIWQAIRDYWPTILIVIGAGIILGSLRRKQEEPVK